ncbi:hypothetical protein OG589_14630 [Sphaerisporangium sp. NBC_01403]|uniref:hypothetical protein n=1 Tax=Sphaerisporangium sp. NBC_01403 TaxID=2903599 RepID=UPI0032434081
MPIDPRSCPGACNARARREHRVYDEQLAAYQQALDEWRIPLTLPVNNAEPPRVTPWYGNPVWCGTDLAARRQELAELDDLACLVVAEADGHRGANGEARVSGSPTPGSPSPTLDDVDELDSWLRSWQGAWTGEDTLARRGHIADSVTRGVSWLLGRADRILGHEAVGADFGREIHAWHTRLSRGSKSDIRVHRKPLRCDRCGCLSLEWPEGSDRVTCARRDCQRILTLPEYEALVEHVAPAARVAVTARAAARPRRPHADCGDLSGRTPAGSSPIPMENAEHERIAL